MWSLQDLDREILTRNQHNQAMESTITCPFCQHVKVEIMPTEQCIFFYECENCHAVLRPQPGDAACFVPMAQRAAHLLKIQTETLAVILYLWLR